MSQATALSSKSATTPSGAGASALNSVTVGVSDLDEALYLFKETMGFIEHDSYELDPSLRVAWQLDPEVTGRIIDLSYCRYPTGRLRLLQLSPVPDTVVRRDHGPNPPDFPTSIGPKAIDFYVRPPISRAISQFEELGYKKRAEPVRHKVGEIESEELVFWGPNGVPILLMVGHVHPANQQRSPTLPGEFSEVATVSVVSRDIEVSREFYRRALGMFCFEENESQSDSRQGANVLTGAPGDSRIHWEMYGRESEPSGKILLLHFFDATKGPLAGKMKPANLGFCLMTISHPDLDALRDRATRCGAEVVTEPSWVQVGNLRQRIMLLRGPNEEMFEVVETSGDADL